MNKHSKVIFVIISLISITFIISGCFGEKFIDSGSTGQKKCKELLEYLDNNDVEGLKSMFCNKIASLPNFEEQVQNAVDFFEGKTVSHDSLIGISGGGRAVDNGKTTQLDICPDITNIVTDAGKRYEIIFYSFLVYTEDRDKEGISELSIKSDDGQECIVGEYVE